MPIYGAHCPSVPSCRSCFKRSPSTGSRTGLKSGQRCQGGATPSAEIGESAALGGGLTGLGGRGREAGAGAVWRRRWLAGWGPGWEAGWLFL